MTNPILTSIRFQDQHQGVLKLQKAINEKYRKALRLDGDYGAITRDTVKEIQRLNNLTQTGDVDEALIRHLGLDLTPARLTQNDIRQCAERLSVPVAAVMSILKTECDWPNKSGYFPSNRPAILFERHYMYRLLGQKNPSLRAKMQAERPDLCQSKWGGYQGGEREWQRITAAAAYDAECALQSASWGLAQVMGAHWKLLGYPSIHHMVRAQAASEVDQLITFERFIRAHPVIHSGLRSQNWEAVARGYNGPAQVSVYAPRLRTNYQAFVRQGF